MRILFCTDGSKISFNALKNISHWVKDAIVDTICVIDWSFLPDDISIEETNFTYSCANVADTILDYAENEIKYLGLKTGSRLKHCGAAIESILEQADSQEYDLILMDDMMPKMTGVETFHKLKENNNFHTPTIALTANAIVGMSEKYIAEGFSDYLAKPIEKDCLQQVLNKFLLTENTKTISKNNQKEDLEILEDDSSTDIKFLKEHGIDVEKGLELLEDIETYKDTMDTFITGATLRLKQLASYKENSDMENYAILVHALKSDSKYLGFTKLAELSYEHELKSKEKDASYIKEHFNELLQEGERIIQISKEYRGNNAK